MCQAFELTFDVAAAGEAEEPVGRQQAALAAGRGNNCLSNRAHLPPELPAACGQQALPSRPQRKGGEGGAGLTWQVLVEVPKCGGPRARVSHTQAPPLPPPTRLPRPLHPALHPRSSTPPTVPLAPHLGCSPLSASSRSCRKGQGFMEPAPRRTLAEGSSDTWSTTRLPGPSKDTCGPGVVGWG